MRRDKRWKRVRLAAKERDGYRCKHCGKAGRLEVDHIVPLQHGGKELDMDNVQTLCVGCHIAKTRKDKHQFLPPDQQAWRDRIISLHSGR